MNKNTILFTALILSLVLIFCYLKYIHGWMEFRKNEATPKDFLNHNVIKKEDYSRDSISVRDQLQKFLNNHQNSFLNKQYFVSTELIIDTIIYSSDFNKLAVFVITKNPTYRQLMPNKKYTWYYDGYCYLGIREKDSFNLKWLRRFYPINWYNRDEISMEIKNNYFKEFAVLKDTDGTSEYKYNLNDKRFWECPVWGEYFSNRYDSLH